MRRFVLKYGFLLLTLICQLNISAQLRGATLVLPTDSLDTWQVSLITCGPGVEVYNQFGHSAIRMKNEAYDIDLIYNYGIFSFNTPNFALRFTLGQTDYLLGIQGYQDFVDWYAYSKRDVREQVLNLSVEEKNTLIGLLNENYKPQNRMYRYNYFYDNCATRPRDMVERAINGEVRYTEDMDTPQEALTYRGLVHEYTAKQPWSRFGIDLLLGSEADKPISRRASMFVPFYLKEYFHNAQKADLQGRNSGLIAEELEITAQDESNWPSPTPLTPMRVFLLLFILVAALTAWGIKQGRSLWGLDLLVFATAGIAGCIIAFMVLFSEHPAVSPNYLLLLLHPLHLIFLYHIVKRVKKLQRSVYLGANMVVILLFLAFWALIPQKFPIEIVPLALILLVRCISNIVLSYRKA